MAHYRTSARSDWRPEAAFAYLADLRNFAEWDPGVRAVRMVGGEMAGLGAAFDVDVKVARGVMTLRYETIAWEAPGRVVVRAETSTVISLDEITVSTTPDGTVVTYDAELSLKGMVRVANPVLGLAFGRIGDRAAAGLRRVLAAEAPTGS